MSRNGVFLMKFHVGVPVSVFTSHNDATDGSPTGEISDVTKCLESFVSQALVFFMNKYAAELKLYIKSALFVVIQK